jgi:hypothetical protein
MENTQTSGMTTPQVQVDLSTLQPVKSGEPVDLKQFHNTQVILEKAEVIQVNSQYTPKTPDGKNLKQWILKVMSPVLLTIGDGESKIEFRASELFNLSQDNKTGALLGFPMNKDANLTKFMKDIGATSPNEIIGKKATVKHYEKETEGGQTRGYLKFKY